MNWALVVTAILDSLAAASKNASDKDYEKANEVLSAIIGKTSENKVVLEQLLARMQLQKLLDEQK
jgi:predicted negative regulator of RcsB-dependent stress response